MNQQSATTDQKQRRARVLRMAWTLGAIAATLYVGFILRAVLGK